jgi:hypothetical protein
MNSTRTVDNIETGSEIAEQLQKDQSKADMLIIMGTSLKIVGIKKMIKDFGTRIRGKNGKIVFVNMTRPPKEIEQYIDYFIQGECDPKVLEISKQWKRQDAQKLQAAVKRAEQKKTREERVLREQKGQVTITEAFKNVKKNSK